MRTFIALELPRAFKDDLAAMARALKGAVDGRFVARDAYHLTLVFLGEVGEAESRDTVAAMDTAFTGLAPAPLLPEGLGKFGRASDATLWLGVGPDPALMLLAERIRDELAAAGIVFDAKPFRPHITLARRVRLPKGALPELPFPAQSQAHTATLFKSMLSREGACYKPLHSVELRG